MNKLMILCAMSIAMTSVVYGRSLDQLRKEYSETPSGDAKIEFIKSSITTAEWRLLAEEFIGIAATNKSIAAKLKPDVIGWMGGWCATPNAAVLASEYDERFAATGLVSPPMYKCFPLSCEAYFSSTNAIKAAWVTNHPARIASIRRHKNGYIPPTASLAEIANILAEECSITSRHAIRYWRMDVEQEKQKIILKAPSTVKRHMRLNGQSFVQQVGGTNVVQIAVDALTTALDAPKMAGLKEWCAEYCPDYQWIDVNWISDEAFKVVSDEYLYGDRELKESGKMMLKGYLGVKKYNDWVKAYNGN